MSHGTEHHLEEAHHAEHAAHDDFNKRVAMSMAIIAACLAFVTLLSHRAHNQTLQKQIEANILKTQASNRWAQYQAKSIRRAQLEAYLKILPVSSQPEKAAESQKVMDDFQKEIKRYRTPAGGEEDKEKLEMASLFALATDLDEKAKQEGEESKHIHHHADRFDLGELGVELALVLCSVSVLTKRSLFWLTGIGVGAVGFLVAMSAFVPFLMPH